MKTWFFCLTPRYHVKATMLSPLCVETTGVNCFTCGSQERRTMLALAQGYIPKPTQHIVGPGGMGCVNEQAQPALTGTRGRQPQEN